MAMPLGWEGFYCFVCTPQHATYRNVRRIRQFTVSFPRPEQILESSLAAGGRFEGDVKPTLAAVPTIPARVVDGRLVEGCSLYLECELERIVDGFGPNSLIVGRVVAASAAREALRGAEVDDADLVHRLGLLAYLAPGRFAVVRDSLAFPYPARLPAARPMADRPQPRSLLDWLDGHRRARWSSCCERLALAESPSLEPETQRGPFAILAARARAGGLPSSAACGARARAITSTRGRGSAAAARPRQLLLGHMDTVWPVGTLAEMPLHEEDGLLFGPGVADMKGGLVEIVFALRALHELGLEPSVTPVVFVNTDEEIGSDDSSRFIRLLARGADARASCSSPARARTGS